MLEGRAVVRETDMQEEMQAHVMELAYKSLDLYESSDCQSIAHHIKQVPLLSSHRISISSSVTIILLCFGKYSTCKSPITVKANSVLG